MHVVAGSWGMTDEQFAIAEARYKRRWQFISLGYAIVSAAQLANYFFGDSTVLGLVAGTGFGICAVGSTVAWRRGMPDTRPARTEGER